MKILNTIKKCIGIDKMTIALAMATMNGSLDDYIILSKLEK